MSDVVFGAGVVTYTFLVTVKDINPDELLVRTPPSLAPLSDEEKPLLDDPQILAEAAVNLLFHNIIVKTRPQGVLLAIQLLGEDADAAPVAILRQKIENGELSGQLVTIRLGITRPDLQPFPGLTWLTSQVRDEPANGLALVYTTAAQLPA